MSGPLSAILATLKALLYGWLLALIALVRSLVSLCRSRRGMTNDEEHERKRARTRCVPIDDPAYVRPDPLIYDQYYLLQLGLNVTWENPDFAIFQGGVPVPSHLLKPDAVYDVVVRVWNASLDCPVVKMPVHLSYLSFGVGTISLPIATQETDVGVKGAPNNPTFLHFSWRTPPDEGHYCLQALLDPVADVEPRNNLGQHNTSVVATQSPATFTFALRNGITARRQFGFWTDTYELGSIGACTDDPEGHCQVVGLMGAFDHAARYPLVFTPRSGRTSPAARSGRPWHGHDGTRSRSSDAAADGSGHRSWRGVTGTAEPAGVT